MSTIDIIFEIEEWLELAILTSAVLYCVIGLV